MSTFSLDDIALTHGTDKASDVHDFASRYDRYFCHLRDEEISLLELGIYQGASLKMWEDYFLKGKVFGFDIQIPRYDGEATLIQGNQSNLDDLADLVALTGQVDIIIDDGSHLHADQVTSFECLWEYVKSGGYYVIEDIHTSYGGGGIDLDYLYGLIDRVNNSEDQSGYGNEYSDIAELIFSKSLLIMKKI